MASVVAVGDESDPPVLAPDPSTPAGDATSPGMATHTPAGDATSPGAGTPAAFSDSPAISDASAGAATLAAFSDSPAISAASAGAATDTFLNVLKAVNQSCKFDVETAQGFVESKDFKALETYIVDILTSVQGTEQHRHPGVLCLVYHAHIAHLVKQGKTTEALEMMNEKVKALLDDEDKLYKPRNLEDQINKVDQCINSREEFTENIMSLLSDYFHLYFPSCLTPSIERNGSVYDFVAEREVNGGEGVYCLACGWVPEGHSEVKLIKHYSRVGHVKKCCSVSQWMLLFLDYIKSPEGTVRVKNLFGTSGKSETPAEAPGKKTSR